jgi:membrane-bound lytic murein transglycosylase D
MPAETKNYVPRLQAIKNILRSPQYVSQMSLPVLPNRPYFESVALYGKHIDLETVAKLANISVDEVKALNPEHYRPVLKVETINLPKDRVAQFKANLNAYQESEKPLSRWASYTVQPGEKPERIADKFKMSLSQLQEANGVSLKSLSKPGQPLLVLTEGSNDLPKGTAPVADMDENTPVAVTEADKPTAKSASKTEKSTAKSDSTARSEKSGKATDKSAKTDKSTKPTKGDKTDKGAKSARDTGSKSPAAKTTDKAATSKTSSQKASSSNDKASGKSSATGKSGGKSDTKDKSGKH